MNQVPEDDSAAVERLCRICHDDAVDNNERVISPCKCAGTMKWVHKSCLNIWRKSQRTHGGDHTKCSDCKTLYAIKSHPTQQVSSADLFVAYALLAAIELLMLREAVVENERQPNEVSDAMSVYIYRALYAMVSTAFLCYMIRIIDDRDGCNAFYDTYVLPRRYAYSHMHVTRSLFATHADSELSVWMSSNCYVWLATFVLTVSSNMLLSRHLLDEVHRMLLDGDALQSVARYCMVIGVARIIVYIVCFIDATVAYETHVQRHADTIDEQDYVDAI